MRPQIQNDFASYRRQLPRMKTEYENGQLPALPVLDNDANAISMFIAEVRSACDSVLCGVTDAPSECHTASLRLLDRLQAVACPDIRTSLIVLRCGCVGRRSK